MTGWTAERSSVNQRVQVGAESNSALGTPVPAAKLLECFDFQFGISPDVNTYTPTGHKYPIIQEENMEWVDGTMAGNGDYNGLIYPLSSAMGAITPTAHGSSASAKDWLFIPPTTGSIVPQTYTFQQGDAIRAHQLSYGIYTQFGYKFDRKTCTVSGKILGQNLQDGITLTASPTAVAVAPIVPKQINVYLDPTNAALGTTLLAKALSGDYTMDSIYNPAWFLNRANASYSAHVDVAPKCTIKITLEADAQGMGLLTSLQVGSTQFLRVNAQGAVIDNNQTVSLGAPSAGTFTLTYKGQTTTAIAYNATSSAVQTALQALSTIGAGNATVSGTGPYIVNFAGALATDTTAMTGNGTGLTGGTFTVTQTQVYQTLQHDMAVKIGKPDAFSDSSGIFAIAWNCQIVEDLTWTFAQKFLLTNTLTTL